MVSTVMPSFPFFVLALIPLICNASPINRQVGISDNVFMTTQNGTDGLEHRVCSIDAVTYLDGETIPTSSPCEHCVCRPPGFACTITSCEYRPGCKAFRRSDQCCPEYQCECEKDGKIYQNGDKIIDSNNPCEVCYCQGGEIICAVIDCYWRNDCPPRYIDNRCCPMYDHCPPPSAQGPIRHRIPSLTSPVSVFNISHLQPTSQAPFETVPTTTTTTTTTTMTTTHEPSTTSSATTTTELPSTTTTTTEPSTSTTTAEPLSTSSPTTEHIVVNDIVEPIAIENETPVHEVPIEPVSLNDNDKIPTVEPTQAAPEIQADHNLQDETTVSPDQDVVNNELPSVEPVAPSPADKSESTTLFAAPVIQFTVLPTQTQVTEVVSQATVLADLGANDAETFEATTANHISIQDEPLPTTSIPVVETFNDGEAQVTERLPERTESPVINVQEVHADSVAQENVATDSPVTEAAHIYDESAPSSPTESILISSPIVPVQIAAETHVADYPNHDDVQTTVSPQGEDLQVPHDEVVSQEPVESSTTVAQPVADDVETLPQLLTVGENQIIVKDDASEATTTLPVLQHELRSEAIDTDNPVASSVENNPAENELSVPVTTSSVHQIQEDEPVQVTQSTTSGSEQNEIEPMNEVNLQQDAAATQLPVVKEEVLSMETSSTTAHLVAVKQDNKDSFDIILDQVAPSKPETLNQIKDIKDIHHASSTGSASKNNNVRINDHFLYHGAWNADNDTVEIINLSAASLPDDVGQNTVVPQVEPVVPTNAVETNQISQLNSNTVSLAESSTAFNNAVVENADVDANKIDISSDTLIEKESQDDENEIREFRTDILRHHLGVPHDDENGTTIAPEAEIAYAEDFDTVPHTPELTTVIPETTSYRNKVQLVAETLAEKDVPNSGENVNKFRLEADIFKGSQETVDSDKVASSVEITTAAASSQDFEIRNDDVKTTSYPVRYDLEITTQAPENLHEEVVHVISQKGESENYHDEGSGSGSGQDEQVTTSIPFKVDVFEAHVEEGAVPTSSHLIRLENDRINEIVHHEESPAVNEFRMEIPSSYENTNSNELVNENIPVPTNAPQVQSNSARTESEVVQQDEIQAEETATQIVSQLKNVNEQPSEAAIKFGVEQVPTTQASYKFRSELEMVDDSATDAPYNVNVVEEATTQPSLKLRSGILDEETTGVPEKLRADVDIAEDEPTQSPSNLRSEIEIATEHVTESPKLRSELEILDDQITEAPSKFRSEIEVADQESTESPSKFRSEIEVAVQETTELPSKFRSEIEVADQESTELPSKFRSEIEVADQESTELPSKFRSEIEVSDQESTESPSKFRTEIEFADQESTESPSKLRSEIEVADQESTEAPSKFRSEIEVADQESTEAISKLRSGIDVESEPTQPPSKFRTEFEAADEESTEPPSKLRSEIEIADDESTEPPSKFRSEIELGNEPTQPPSKFRTDIEVADDESTQNPFKVESEFEVVEDHATDTSSKLRPELDILEDEQTEASAKLRSEIDILEDSLTEAPSKLRSAIEVVVDQATEAPSKFRSEIEILDDPITETPSKLRSGIEAVDNEVAETPAKLESGIQILKEQPTEAPSKFRSEIEVMENLLTEAPSKLRSEIEFADEQVTEASPKDLSSFDIIEELAQTSSELQAESLVLEGRATESSKFRSEVVEDDVTNAPSKLRSGIDSAEVLETEAKVVNYQSTEVPSKFRSEIEIFEDKPTEVPSKFRSEIEIVGDDATIAPSKLRSGIDSVENLQPELGAKPTEVPSKFRSELEIVEDKPTEAPPKFRSGIEIVEDKPTEVPSKFRSEFEIVEDDVTNAPSKLRSGIDSAEFSEAEVKVVNYQATEAPSKFRSEIEIFEDKPTEVPSKFRSEFEIVEDKPTEGPLTFRTDVEIVDDSVTETVKLRSGLESTEDVQTESPSKLRSELNIIQDEVTEIPSKFRSEIDVVESQPTETYSKLRSGLDIVEDSVTETANFRTGLVENEITEVPSKFRSDILDDQPTEASSKLQSENEIVEDKPTELPSKLRSGLDIVEDVVTEAVPKLRLDIDTDDDETEAPSKLRSELEIVDSEPTNSPSKFRSGIDEILDEEQTESLKFRADIPVTEVPSFDDIPSPTTIVNDIQPESDFVEVSTSSPSGFAAIFKESLDAAVTQISQLLSDVAATVSPIVESEVPQDSPVEHVVPDVLPQHADEHIAPSNDEGVPTTVSSDRVYLSDEAVVTTEAVERLRSGIDDKEQQDATVAPAENIQTTFQPEYTTKKNQTIPIRIKVKKNKVKLPESGLPKIQPISPDLSRSNPHELRSDFPLPTEKDGSWLSRAVNQFRRLSGFRTYNSNGRPVYKVKARVPSRRVSLF